MVLVWTKVENVGLQHLHAWPRHRKRSWPGASSGRAHCRSGLVVDASPRSPRLAKNGASLPGIVSNFAVPVGYARNLDQQLSATTWLAPRGCEAHTLEGDLHAHSCYPRRPHRPQAVSRRPLIASGAATERMALQAAGATQATAHAVPYRLQSSSSSSSSSSGGGGGGGRPGGRGKRQPRPMAADSKNVRMFLGGFGVLVRPLLPSHPPLTHGELPGR